MMMMLMMLLMFFTTANDDATVIDAHAAITDAIDVDDVVATDPVVVAARVASPPKAHKTRSRPRSPYCFGRILPRMHFAFSSISIF